MLRRQIHSIVDREGAWARTRTTSPIDPIKMTDRLGIKSEKKRANACLVGAPIVDPGRGARIRGGEPMVGQTGDFRDQLLRQGATE